MFAPPMWLPDDLWCLVAAYLHVPDLASFRGTSNAFCALVPWTTHLVRTRATSRLSLTTYHPPRTHCIIHGCTHPCITHLVWTGLEVFTVSHRYLPYCEVHTDRYVLNVRSYER